jgi:hypothetical protein
MRIRRLVSVLGLVLLVTGCGALSGRSSWDPFASTQDRQISIRVENPTTADVTVFALSPGRRVELGIVGSRSTQQYRIAWSSTQDIRFQIDPLGGRRHTTPPTGVSPGDRVELWVQQPLERSFVRR